MSRLTNITADYVDEDTERHNGRHYKRCPVCSETKVEEEIHSYYGLEDGKQIDCCVDCVLDFEMETGIDVDADVLEQDKFNALWDWVLKL